MAQSLPPKWFGEDKSCVARHIDLTITALIDISSLIVTDVFTTGKPGFLKIDQLEVFANVNGSFHGSNFSSLLVGGSSIKAATTIGQSTVAMTLGQSHHLNQVVVCGTQPGRVW